MEKMTPKVRPAGEISRVMSTHGENREMTYARKRHRSDSNAEKMIRDGETTDHKGRSMSEPANLLEIYRETNRNGEAVTLTGHTPREKGARPFFEAYGIWLNGHLVTLAESRSKAGEKTRALRKALPTMTESEMLEDYSALATYVHAVIEGNAWDMSHEELKSAYRSLPEYDDYRGVEMSASDVLELAESKGLETPEGTDE